MNGTVVHYNVRDYAGRAITHLLERSALAGVVSGLTVTEHSGGGRTLIVHPYFAEHPSQGEAALLLVIESLAGDQSVNLRWVLADVDEPSRRAIAEAVSIAAGLEVVPS
jgi:hypothetical protein